MVDSGVFLEQEIRSIFKKLKIDTLVDVPANGCDYSPPNTLVVSDLWAGTGVQHCHNVVYKVEPQAHRIQLSFFSQDAIAGLVVINHILSLVAEAATKFGSEDPLQSVLINEADSGLSLLELEMLSFENWIRSKTCLKFLRTLNHAAVRNYVKVLWEPREAISKALYQVTQEELTIEADDLGLYNEEDTKRKLRVLLGLEPELQL